MIERWAHPNLYIKYPLEEYHLMEFRSADNKILDHQVESRKNPEEHEQTDFKAFSWGSQWNGQS